MYPIYWLCCWQRRVLFFWLRSRYDFDSSKADIGLASARWAVRDDARCYQFVGSLRQHAAKG